MLREVALKECYYGGMQLVGTRKRFTDTLLSKRVEEFYSKSDNLKET